MHTYPKFILTQALSISTIKIRRFYKHRSWSLLLFLFLTQPTTKVIGIKTKTTGNWQLASWQVGKLRSPNSSSPPLYRDDPESHTNPDCRFGFALYVYDNAEIQCRFCF
jgi:hypothetical protein